MQTAHVEEAGAFVSGVARSLVALALFVTRTVFTFLAVCMHAAHLGCRCGDPAAGAQQAQAGPWIRGGAAARLARHSLAGLPSRGWDGKLPVVGCAHDAPRLRCKAASAAQPSLVKSVVYSLLSRSGLSQGLYATLARIIFCCLMCVCVLRNVE